MEAVVDPARIARARDGDVTAFEALVEARVGSMMRTAMAILGREDEARDAVQDALVTAWHELASLRDPGRVRRLADPDPGQPLPARAAPDRDRARAARSRTTTSRMPTSRRRPTSRAASSTGRPWSAPSTACRSTSARSSSCTTSTGGSLASIAAVLRIPEGTAKSRLFHARRSLERALDREADAMTGRPTDDELREMLEARASRVSPDADREAHGGRPGGDARHARCPRRVRRAAGGDLGPGRAPAGGIVAVGLVAVILVAVLGGQLAAPKEASSAGVGDTHVPESIPTPRRLGARQRRRPARGPAGAWTGADLATALAARSIVGQVVVVDGALTTRLCNPGGSCVVDIDGLEGVPVVFPHPPQAAPTLVGPGSRTALRVREDGGLDYLGQIDADAQRPLTVNALAHEYSTPGRGLFVVGWLWQRATDDIGLSCPATRPLAPSCLPDGRAWLLAGVDPLGGDPSRLATGMVVTLAKQFGAGFDALERPVDVPRQLLGRRMAGRRDRGGNHRAARHRHWFVGAIRRSHAERAAGHLVSRQSAARSRPTSSTRDSRTGRWTGASLSSRASSRGMFEPCPHVYGCFALVLPGAASCRSTQTPRRVQSSNAVSRAPASSCSRPATAFSTTSAPSSGCRPPDQRRAAHDGSAVAQSDARFGLARDDRPDVLRPDRTGRDTVSQRCPVADRRPPGARRRTRVGPGDCGLASGDAGARRARYPRDRRPIPRPQHGVELCSSLLGRPARGRPARGLSPRAADPLGDRGTPRTVLTTTVAAALTPASRAPSDRRLGLVKASRVELGVDRVRVRELKNAEDGRFLDEHPRSAELLERGRRVMPYGVPMAWMEQY